MANGSGSDMTRANLRIAYVAATPKTAWQFGEKARLRARVLAIACFATLEECAAYLVVPLRTLSRWLSGETSIPAWALLKLEARARELNVRPAEEPREAA